jgi:hypothetical protein
LIERLYVEDPKTYLAYGFGKPIEIREVTSPEGDTEITPAELALARKIAMSL